MDLRELHAMDGVAERMQTRFPMLPAAQVVALIDRIHASFEGALVRSYVPLLVENLSRNALSRWAQGVPMPVDRAAPAMGVAAAG